MPHAAASPLPHVTALLLLVGSGLVTILTGCSDDSRADAHPDTASDSSSSADGAAGSDGMAGASPPVCRLCIDRRLRASEGAQRLVIASPGLALPRERRLLEERIGDQQTKPASVPGLLPVLAAPPALGETWVSAWGGRG